MKKLYTVSKTRWGVDCGSDHELLIANFRLKLKKVGKTTRPFSYYLNVTGSNRKNYNWGVDFRIQVIYESYFIEYVFPLDRELPIF